jgi:hypothetical protein
VGAGRDEAEFDEQATDRSNEGSYEILELSWNRTKLAAQARVRFVDREASEGSTFEAWDGTDGSAQVVWSPRERLSWGVYGLRQVGYPVLTTGSLFVEDRFGTSLGFGIGHRAAATVYAETGELEYPDDGRVEDVETLGATLALPIGRRVQVDVGARRTNHGSGDSERETLEWRAGVRMGTILGRWF